MPRCEQRIDCRVQDKGRLHVVCALSNPMMYARRYELAREFLARMALCDVNLIVVEHAFGSRAFEVTDACNPHHVQVRGNDDLWIKESLLRIGMHHLPADWEKVAWIDMDVAFINPDWVHDTLHALERHKVVQLFHDAIDLGPDGEVVAVQDGFVSSYLKGRPRRVPAWCYPYGPYGSGRGRWVHHSGYAWAARRSALNDLGGLIDWAILGASDHMMALALIGLADLALPPGLHPNYVALLKDWEGRADRFIAKDVGVVDGSIAHYWHGKKRDRRYGERWQILRDNQFDPLVDIKRGWNELIRLDANKPQLRDQLRAYFRGRNEDSIDLV